MEIPILLEALPADGYRATTLSPMRVCAQGASREEALERVSRLVQEQMADAELVHLQVRLPSEPHPWHPLAGIWKDHPDLKEVEEHLRAYRSQVDADPDRL